MATVATKRAGSFSRRRRVGPSLGRPWKLWDLDSELRYLPVVEALPASGLPVCEIGSGTAGLAAWTDRAVVGVDPGPDERHGEVVAPANLLRVRGDGAHVPLADRSACAAVAVDTFEHIPPDARGAVVDEMKRVTADGGRVVIIGPSGPAAVDGDRRVLARMREIGADHIIVWLEEHFEHGLPTAQELVGLLGDERIASIEVTWVFNIRLWWLMHSVVSRRIPEPWPMHRVHHLVWRPVAEVARRVHRGPCYRCMVVAQLDGPPA